MVVIESLDYNGLVLPYEPSIVSLIKYLPPQNRFTYISGGDRYRTVIKHALRMDNSDPLVVIFHGLSIPQMLGFPFGELKYLNWMLQDEAFWEYDMNEFLAEQPKDRTVIIISITSHVGSTYPIEKKDARKLPIEPWEFKPVKCKWMCLKLSDPFHISTRSVTRFNRTLKAYFKSGNYVRRYLPSFGLIYNKHFFNSYNQHNVPDKILGRVNNWRTISRIIEK